MEGLYRENECCRLSCSPRALRRPAGTANEPPVGYCVVLGLAVRQKHCRDTHRVGVCEAKVIHACRMLEATAGVSTNKGRVTDSRLPLALKDASLASFVTVCATARADSNVRGRTFGAP